MTDTMSTNAPEFSHEDTVEHLRGLQASVDLIDALIAENDRSEEHLDTMDRNVRHIGIMCAMSHIRESGADLAPFTDAQHRGAAWLAA